MKRQWRIGRTILAVLLVGFAVPVVAFWPTGPLWTIPAQDVVGFDEANGLFYTTSHSGHEQWLHTYRLVSGELVASQLLNLPPNSVDCSAPWPLTLSGNKRHLIAISSLASQFHVLSLPTLSPVRIQRPKSHVTHPWSFGLSHDGACLLMNAGDVEYDQIEIVDLEKAISTELQIRHRGVVINAGFGNALPTEDMQLTTDRRYLATQVLGESTVIYDLIQGKEVARTGEPAIPRLTADGKSLVCLSQQDRKTVQAIYRFIDGRWVERAPWTAPYCEGEYFVQTCDSQLVTAWNEFYEHSWIKHSPDVCKTIVKKVLTAGRVHLRFWDLRLGKPKTELNLSLPIAWSDEVFGGFNFSLVSLPFGPIKVSSDARFVAWKDEDRLALWETNQHRPSLHYIIMAACLVLALWLAWPRRVKFAALSDSSPRRI
jgi:hypothetical protein